MEGIIQILSRVIACSAETGKLLLEGFGIFILIIAGVRAAVCYFKKDSHVGLKLAKETSTALAFLLGGEVLGTIVATEWSNILMLGAIVVLRVTINFVLMWEISHEEQTIRKVARQAMIEDENRTNAAPKEAEKKA